MNMERLLALYNTASPSGREKSIARLIMAELDRMGVRHTQDRTGNIYAVKGQAETYPCVNLSCGYYEPHTDHEYTVIADLLKCQRLVKHIIRIHKTVSRHEYKEYGWPSVSHWDDLDDCNGYGWLYPHLLKGSGFGARMLESTTNNDKTKHKGRTEK